LVCCGCLWFIAFKYLCIKLCSRYSLLASVKTLRLLPNIKNCAVIAPMDVIDVVDAGIVWKLVPATHCCKWRNEAKEKVKEYLAIGRVKNEKEWSDRGSVPEINWNEISDRKFGGIPRIKTIWSNWRSPEPGEDWFG
jgi:hypothetical protein